MYAIWREEAYDLGVIYDESNLGETLKNLEKIGYSIHNLSIWSDVKEAERMSKKDHQIRSLFGKYSYEGVIERLQGVSRLAALLMIYDKEASSMGNSMGETIISLHRMGFVLCDVRIPNIGSVLREGSLEYAIVDPGMSLYVK